MSERYIDMCHWERFQHKDIWRKSGGRPPWIKNYTQLLHKDEYTTLSCAQRGILHGLWLLYASTGRSVSESVARRYLVGSEGDAKYWRVNIESLRNAGFIEILSQPIRAVVAPRVEERREETLSKDVSRARAATAEREIPQNQNDRGKGWVDDLSRYTGCRLVRGTHGFAHKHDTLGTDPLPADWPYPRPTRSEIAAALEESHA